MRKIILASQSPRRKELLAGMGLEFDVVPSKFDEKLDDDRTPEEVAVELATGKAAGVADDYPACVVIGSDTIVAIDGHQLEKPRDKADAHRMLRRLSGTHHEVATSIAVICRAADVLFTAVDTTTVYFKPYDNKAVAGYVESGDSLDKAGAYGIQSGAAPLIDHIEGHYDTVIGLPTRMLVELLSRLGIDAKPVDLQPPVKQLI